MEALIQNGGSAVERIEIVMGYDFNRQVKPSKPRPLDRMLLRLLLLRLFLPSLVVTLLTVGLTGYLWGRGLGIRQLLLARSLAHTVDDYLEHASRVLGAAAQMAETSTPEELAPYMQATWQAYGYFDALYRLDESGVVTVLVPPDPRYQGLDLSHQPYFQQARAQTGMTISPPFTSLRTGQPAVYTAWPLSAGGMVVGELNLGALHEAIATGEGEQYFIADRSGTLLAHPQSDLVAQQANVGHMEIVQRGLTGEATLPYATGGTFVLGSTTRVERTGWVVVAQIPLSVAYGPYVWSIGLALLLAPVVWLAMILHFRQQLRHHVVTPLAQLSQGATALAAGDFDQGVTLAAIPSTFAEVGVLAANFERMSQAIQARQEALKEYSERLEEMVEERTQELRETQEQLVRREKLAVLGQLAGGVSHELRNPLGAIKNAAYFLNMVLEEPDPEVKEMLEILEKEVGTSEKIISSLLDFARTKAPIRREVDLNDVLQATLSRIAVPENVEVVSQLDEALPTILADPDQLRQVFGNIILNGIQAMTLPSPVEVPEGNRLVIKSEVASPESVAVSFTDTGVGIPEESLDKLFEPLFTTKAKGIGLGLALVKTLVEGHSGSIEVESQVGKSSTFIVKLPIGEKPVLPVPSVVEGSKACPEPSRRVEGEES